MPANDESAARAYNVEYAERAEAEIQDIFLNLLRRSEQGADRWMRGLLDEVNRHTELVSLFPGIVRLAPDAEAFRPTQVYQLVYGKRTSAYRILYTLIPADEDGEPGALRVLCIRHGSRRLLTDPDEESE